uniref:Uncharacterized protein n=1 Tax=viral metagenome TaxID=1070528 RepID=A0A6C0HLP5_9ZZZZ
MTSLEANDVIEYEDDISDLRSMITNDMTTLNGLYATSTTSVNATNQASIQTDQLAKRKKELIKDVEMKEAIINRSNRDFSDVKDTLPEHLPKKTLNVIEDYTMAILAMSYLFMVIAAVYLYTITSTEPMSAMLRGIGYATVASLFAWMGLYYIC